MRFYITILTILFFNSLFAQPDSLFLNQEIVKTIDEPLWKKGNKASLDLSEVAFINWNAGGNNSISALLGVESFINYKNKHLVWSNRLQSRYGVNKQQGQGFRKTDDAIEINSNFGYKPDGLSNYYYSARLNFKTQYTNGYKYPDRETIISKFMAPGYLFFGGGVEYGKQIEEFSLYLSPMTLKATFVLDEDLANAGAFGVREAVLDDEGHVIIEGERVRREVGILINNEFRKEIANNISMVHNVGLYTDYLNSFGNIDIDWQLNFDFKVNSFVRATLGSHLKYDDDVKRIEIDEETEMTIEKGPKAQWKQLLGVGVAVNF